MTLQLSCLLTSLLLLGPLRPGRGTERLAKGHGLKTAAGLALWRFSSSSSSSSSSSRSQMVPLCRPCLIGATSTCTVLSALAIRVLTTRGSANRPGSARWPAGGVSPCDQSEAATGDRSILPVALGSAQGASETCETESSPGSMRRRRPCSPHACVRSRAVRYPASRTTSLSVA